MRPFSAFCCLLILLAFMALTACGGGNSTPVFGNPATITVTPASTSLALGTVENLNAVVQDSKGTTLFTSGGAASSSVTFTSSNTNVLQVADNGLLCAGKWDSLTVPVVCAPFPDTSNPPNGIGQASVTVTSGSITSTPVAIFVHRPVARVDIIGAPRDLGECISQSATKQLSVKVFSSASGDLTTDITSSVGPVTLTPTPADVVSIDANLLATAHDPGIASIVGDVGTFRSTPVPFAVCPVTKITIHKKGATDTAITLNSGENQTLSADVTDKNGNIIISKANSTSTTAGLTWSATSPSSTVVGLTPIITDVTATTTNDATVTYARAGTQSIVASCTPPLCNAGYTPVYGNLVIATSTGTTSSVVFVTGTDTTTLIPIPTSSNTPGTAITLSNQPNSLLIGRDGARALLGSAGGLMVVDANALSLTTTIPSITGKVLAIAPDGKTAVVSDTTKNQVFVGDVTNSNFQIFPLDGVTAAAFSADGFRLYVASSTKVTVITPGQAPKTLPFGATDVTTYPNGSLAYFASGNVPFVASCSIPQTPTGTVPATGAQLVKALPSGSQVLVAGVDTLNAIDTTVDSSTCAPTVTNTPNPIAVTVTPFQIIATSDGARAFITNTSSNIIAYKASDKSVANIALTGAPAASFTGGVTLDGTQLYVGVLGAGNSTPVVHRIDLTTNTDAQQITASTTVFTPNLVAVRP